MSEARNAEDDVRAMYRVVNDNGWKVENMWNGEWRIAFYCSSEESANKCLDRCVARNLKWQAMSREERMKSILR